MYTQPQRRQMAAKIVQSMRSAYAEEGVDGDFEDARLYLSDYASTKELAYEYDKWVTRGTTTQET